MLLISDSLDLKTGSRVISIDSNKKAIWKMFKDCSKLWI